MNKPGRHLIGHVGVDTGRLVITDPCYLDSERVWERIGDEMPPTDGSELFAALPYLMGHPGCAVVFHSGVGDGLYPVYATYEDLKGFGMRIMKVEVLFNE